MFSNSSVNKDFLAGIIPGKNDSFSILIVLSLLNNEDNILRFPLFKDKKTNFKINKIMYIFSPLYSLLFEIFDFNFL